MNTEVDRYIVNNLFERESNVKKIIINYNYLLKIIQMAIYSNDKQQIFICFGPNMDQAERSLIDMTYTKPIDLIGANDSISELCINIFLVV